MIFCKTKLLNLAVQLRSLHMHKFGNFNTKYNFHVFLFQFSSHDFVGCIRSLSIDSHEVTLTSSLFIHKSSGITNGCLRTSSSGSCDANTCGTGGICTDLWSDFQCRCTDNKEGKNCENLKVKLHLWNRSMYLLYLSSPSLLIEGLDFIRLEALSLVPGI